MSHGHVGGHGAGHEGHGGDAADNTPPVTTRLPIRMTPALAGHPLVAEILVDRARARGRGGE